jgi:hypothetical protein
MVKWMAKADQAHQIGLQSTLQAILIAVESGGGGVEELVCEDFYRQKFGMVLLVAPHLMVKWSNGWHRRIQRITLVYDQPSTLF